MGGMDLDKAAVRPGAERGEVGEGCLVAVIRIPVRVVVLVLVVPVRVVWDLVAAGARALYRGVLRPVGLGCGWLYGAVLAPVARFIGMALFVRPWVALWRYGVVVPMVWLYENVLAPVGRGIETLLTPLGRALGAVLVWLGKALFVWPWVALWRHVLVSAVWLYGYVLTPIGHGTLWLLTGIAKAVVLLVTPLGWVYRAVLTPVGREIAAAVGVAWRIAGHVSRAVGRAVKWLAWLLIGQPVSWIYRAVCTPVGHVVRDYVWIPARKAAVETGRAIRGVLRSAGETVRQARRDAWRALVGPPRSVEPVKAPVDGARTLGSTTTVPGAVPAPEISLRKQV